MTRGAPPRRTTPKPPPKPDGGDRGSRAEHAYLRLREAIRGGALRPGDELREVELAARLGVSRTPVREAIRRLTGDGLVDALVMSLTSIRAVAMPPPFPPPHPSDNAALAPVSSSSSKSFGIVDFED